jgi:hypothetical protein
MLSHNASQALFVFMLFVATPASWVLVVWAWRNYREGRA